MQPEQRLNVVFEVKHGGAQDNKFMVTHSMTEQRCLTFAIAEAH
jgi:hypothetical protein